MVARLIALKSYEFFAAGIKPSIPVASSMLTDKIARLIPVNI